MNWQDKQTVHKGNVGERLVRQLLERDGWVVYCPETDGPHAFDRLAVKNKETIAIIEVKTKAKLTHYNATGFNTKHFNEYLKIKEKYDIEVFVYFVDEELGKIYGAPLSALCKPMVGKDNKQYPLELRSGQTIFSMELMQVVRALTSDEITEIKSLTFRNPAYEPPAA